MPAAAPTDPSAPWRNARASSGCCTGSAGLGMPTWPTLGSRPITLSRSFFFFQAEDGIRDIGVTGVQTCALPIYLVTHGSESLAHELFIHERTVNFSGVEESDAAFDRCPNERNHLLPCPCHCAVTRTQPHAAKPHGRDFKTPCS